MTDPYEIAYLRGGKSEALRVAAISLIDRGLLKYDAEEGQIASRFSDGLEYALRPIEKGILIKFRRPQSSTHLFDDESLQGYCEDYQNSLGERHLVATNETYELRQPIFVLRVFILIGISRVKIGLALYRGEAKCGFPGDSNRALRALCPD